MKRRQNLALGLFSIVAVLIGRWAASAPTPKQEENVSAPPESLIRRVVVLTNEERAKHGLPPLKIQENLSVAAEWMVEDMASHDYFGHTDREGRNIEARLPAFGYADYHEIGENLAAGQPSPEAVVAGWMKSPGHRANLLNRNVCEIGVGYAYTDSGKYHRYWAQEFGCRFNAYPVVINKEEPETRSDKVKLTIYGKGWAQQMRLSNDGERWTRWEPYRPQCDWKLLPGSGTRTVTVELRRRDETASASDSIELLP